MTDDAAWPLAQHVCRTLYADLPASATDAARRDISQGLSRYLHDYWRTRYRARAVTARDIVAFLRHGTVQQRNPCAGNIQRAYAFGASQAGAVCASFSTWASTKMSRSVSSSTDCSSTFWSGCRRQPGFDRGEFGLAHAHPVAAPAPARVKIGFAVGHDRHRLSMLKHTLAGAAY
jgi:hypothetical protein